VKASFPYFEHGLHLRQPAGYRIVKDADGSVTVASDIRFTQHQEFNDGDRYGRYTDETLNVFVTVKPGTTEVFFRVRKENPTPLPRSDRLWNVACFPAERLTRQELVKDKKTGKEEMKEVADVPEMKKKTQFLYPPRWVTDHGPTTVHTSPHWTTPDNWDVSHFAIDCPYPFGGGYYPQEKINRLRIHDTEFSKGPGSKLYSCFWAPMFELWGGQGLVFEHPGALKPAHEPVEFTHRFYIAQNIGPVSYANDDVAVSVAGKQFEMVAPRAGTAIVADATGNVVATGPIGPHTVLKGTFDGAKLVVKLDGKQVLDQTFPLDRPIPAKETPVPLHIQELLAKLKAPSPYKFELEGHQNHIGLTTCRDALGAARAVQSAGNPEQVLSLARVCIRLGALDEAKRLAELVPGPGADYVLGLIAWEKGEAADFKSAGWEAEYMRALQAVQQKNTDAAIKHVDAYLAKVPTAWRPRLAKAFWSKDAAAAQQLAQENAGSPEAQLVLNLLGQPNELEALLKNNPHADLHIKLFRAELEEGKWQPLPRFQPKPEPPKAEPAKTEVKK